MDRRELLKLMDGDIFAIVERVMHGIDNERRRPVLRLLLPGQRSPDRRVRLEGKYMRRKPGQTEQFCVEAGLVAKSLIRPCRKEADVAPRTERHQRQRVGDKLDPGALNFASKWACWRAPISANATSS